jgi:hypothetical protein
VIFHLFSLITCLHKRFPDLLSKWILARNSKGPVLQFCVFEHAFRCDHPVRDKFTAWQAKCPDLFLPDPLLSCKTTKSSTFIRLYIHRMYNGLYCDHDTSYNQTSARDSNWNVQRRKEIFDKTPSVSDSVNAKSYTKTNSFRRT